MRGGAISTKEPLRSPTLTVCILRTKTSTLFQRHTTPGTTSTHLTECSPVRYALVNALALTLNSGFSLRDQGVSNALGLDKLPRHRWYFVKEGFSPRLVEQAITTDGVGRGELLLDPFSGSGTAPLTAVLLGLRSRAFEVNPF